MLSFLSEKSNIPMLLVLAVPLLFVAAQLIFCIAHVMLRGDKYSVFFCEVFYLAKKVFCGCILLLILSVTLRNGHIKCISHPAITSCFSCLILCFLFLLFLFHCKLLQSKSQVRRHGIVLHLSHLSAAAIAHLHFIQHWKVTCFYFGEQGVRSALENIPLL